MMWRMTICGVLILGILLIGGAVAADTLSITAPQATVRSGPSLTHSVLTTVPQGAIFPLLATQQEWHQILLDDGRKGWIAHALIALPQASRALRLTTTPPLASVQRRALVIGNASYQTAPLKNPLHDAADISTSLQQLGFAVTTLRDADQRTMEQAIRTFGRQLRQGGVGLFYYAGHGMQVQEDNYLIPVGARIDAEADVKYEAVHVGRVLDALEEAGNRLNIVILDACRDNPFARSWRSTQRGLAAVQAARGTLVAYATAPGAVAADGDIRNGLYTQHLLQQMRVAGQSVEQVFKRVRTAVMAETDGKQVPWESSSLTGDFYFHQIAAAGVPTPPLVVSRPAPVASPTPAALASAPRSAEPTLEAQMWAMVKDSAHREDLVDFLSEFPQSQFVPLARLRLRQLERGSDQRQRQFAMRQVKVSFTAQTPGVTYDRPNPADVAYGEELTVTAAKEGYQSKTRTVAALVQDTVIDFGTLDKREEPIDGFVKFDNGTALDTRTNLLWMTQDFRNIEGQAVRSWHKAQQWAQKMNQQRYGGYSDWRVPTIKEY